MMQQLSFSPVENILAVLFTVVILGYLLNLLVRSLRNWQRGYHTVNRAKGLQQGRGYRGEPTSISGKRYGKFRSNRDGKRQERHF